MLMETLQKVYVIERFSSVSNSTVVEGVYKTFYLAQRVMHAKIRDDIRCFRKGGYNYPIISSSVDVDDESVYYNTTYKHDVESNKVFKDIFIKYSINSFHVISDLPCDIVSI